MQTLPPESAQTAAKARYNIVHTFPFGNTQSERHKHILASGDKEKPLDKDKALEMALTQLEKQFGKGSVMRLGESPRMTVEAISTGSLALDLALGVGGVPRGRITEIHGAESSGKTTIAYHIVAEAQRLGGVAAFVDAEHSVDPEYARNLGVDINKLLISQPSTGEEALEIMDALVRSGAIDVVVLDSVAALVPKAEIEGEMGDSHMGLQARLMSQAMRKLNGSISKTNTAAIFINQIREKIGVMFGNPETTPGGRALKFYASRHAGRAPHRDAEAGHGHGRQPGQSQSGQEQSRPAVPPGRVRHHVRQRHLPLRVASLTSASRWT